MTQITCAWCRTTYNEFQSNCDNCGAALPLQVEPRRDQAVRQTTPPLLKPPMPPRDLPKNYLGKRMFSDGWSLTAGIFAFIGGIFTMVGGGLTLGIVTAFVGIPFLGMGLMMFAGGVGLLVWRYQKYQAEIMILRGGQTALGEITSTEENYMVTVNNRHPWKIEYTFQAHGRVYNGETGTLKVPGLELQPGRRTYVLYLAEDPNQSAIYPPI